MSDENLPPEEDGPQEVPTIEAVEPSIHFFNDGLEEPPSLHAAATRASEEELTSSDDVEEAEPTAFPLPIELSIFQGSQQKSHNTNASADSEEDTELFSIETDNVICLMPQPPVGGAIWNLNPAGEETVREAFDANEPLTPPEPGMLEGAVEALLFAADGPLNVMQLNGHLAEPGTRSIRTALDNIQSRFRRTGSGIRLVEVAKGWQFRTDLRTARYVSKMRGEQPFKLSKAAIETLSIVAYRQPVTRAEVEDLRGVDPGGILRMLSERGLIAVTGRKDEPGRPLLYGTTPDFLSLFGLRDLSDLPTLRDLRDLQRDDAREGIGGTDDDIHTALVDALIPDECPPETIPPIQEVLPLEEHDPVD